MLRDNPNKWLQRRLELYVFFFLHLGAILLTSESEQSSTILLKTHDLQHTPEGAQGGRTKNQVNGAPF